ncbi:MAG: 2Fe-2S iron-sulfur cluster-binding protein [Myxococcaceae bacterium]
MPRLDSAPSDISVELDGQLVPARKGEPVAVSLWAADEKVFSRSIKYHRPRGPFCMTGSCAQCLMRVNGVPNIATCCTPAAPGMRLERQNAFPSAKLDLFGLTDWLFPRGLNHHEMFAGVPIAEQVMAKVARQLAGLGKLPDKEPPRRLPPENVQIDTVVVGAGAAGLGAAEVLKHAGVLHLLLEREEEAGGRLIFGPPEEHSPNPALPEGEAIRLGTTALGVFEEPNGHFLAASTSDRLLTIHPKRFVLCNGGHPMLTPFENNDLPGVIAARAVSRMIRRHRLLPGKKIAVVGEPIEARAIAALIRVAGGDPVAIGGKPLRAHGVSDVSSITVLLDGKEQKIDCDAVALCAPASPSFELARQCGARVDWNPEAQVFCVQADAEGRTQAKGVYAAGELLGPMGSVEAHESGKRAAKALLADRGAP